MSLNRPDIYQTREFRAGHFPPPQSMVKGFQAPIQIVQFYMLHSATNSLLPQLNRAISVGQRFDMPGDWNR